MQIANCFVSLNNLGSNVPKVGVTPAEIVVLRTLHQHAVGRDPITDISDVKEVNRTSKEELERLRLTYGGTVLNGKTPVLTHLYPGDSPTLPQKFSEVNIPGHEPKAAPTPVKPSEPAKPSDATKH